MNITFKEFTDEIDALIEFLTSDTWSFHGTPNPKSERIRKSYEDHYYNSEDAKTFWIIMDSNIKVGMMRIYDLEDGTPLFDIRISSRFKGLGIGTIAVKWLNNYIFSNYPDKDRIEANTRQDNYAMRCVFHKCGYVKEAHHRKAWPDVNGTLYDAIGYGITKDDWKSGKITPIKWEDFKY